MIIEVKYDIGDKIKWQYGVKSNNYITCPFCNGENVIIGKDGSQIICPKCHGNGNIREEIQHERVDIIDGVYVNYVNDKLNNSFNGPEIKYVCGVIAVNQENIIGLSEEDATIDYDDWYDNIEPKSENEN